MKSAGANADGIGSCAQSVASLKAFIDLYELSPTPEHGRMVGGSLWEARHRLIEIAEAAEKVINAWEVARHLSLRVTARPGLAGRLALELDNLAAAVKGKNAP